MLACSEDTQDLDAEYDDAAKILAAPKPKVVERVSPEDAQEDYYKAFRTRVRPSCVPPHPRELNADSSL